MKRKLAALVTLLVIPLYLPIIYFSLNRSSFFLEQFEGAGLNVRALFMAHFYILIVHYAFVIHLAEEIELLAREKLTRLSYWILIFLLTLVPPYFSLDAAGYMVVARNWSVFGLNPYTTVLGTATQNEWLRQLPEGWWAEVVAYYGPLFVLLAAPFGWVTSSLFLSVLLFKFLVTATFVFTVVQLKKILSERELPSYYIIPFALNPTILIHTVIDAHNDTFVMLSVVFALLCIYQKRYAASAAFVGIGASLKHLTAVFIPVFWVQGRRPQIGDGLVATAICGGIFSACCLIFGQSPLSFLKIIVQVSSFDCFYQCTPVVRIFQAAFHEQATFATKIAMFAVLAAVVVRYLIYREDVAAFFFWAFLTPLLVAAYWLTPWYLIPVIPLAIVKAAEGKNSYGAITLLLTAYSLLRYFGY